MPNLVSLSPTEVVALLQSNTMDAITFKKQFAILAEICKSRPLLVLVNNVLGIKNANYDLGELIGNLARSEISLSKTPQIDIKKELGISGVKSRYCDSFIHVEVGFDVMRRNDLMLKKLSEDLAIYGDNSNDFRNNSWFSLFIDSNYLSDDNELFLQKVVLALRLMIDNSNLMSAFVKIETSLAGPNSGRYYYLPVLSDLCSNMVVASSDDIAA